MFYFFLFIFILSFFFRLLCCLFFGLSIILRFFLRIFYFFFFIFVFIFIIFLIDSMLDNDVLSCIEDSLIIISIHRLTMSDNRLDESTRISTSKYKTNLTDNSMINILGLVFVYVISPDANS